MLAARTCESPGSVQRWSSAATAPSPRHLRSPHGRPREPPRRGRRATCDQPGDPQTLQRASRRGVAARRRSRRRAARAAGRARGLSVWRPRRRGSVSVVDASVLVNALTNDGEPGDVAQAELARDSRWAAPEHVRAETFSGIRGRVLEGKITVRRGREAAEALAALNLDLVTWSTIHERVWELRDNVIGYDAAYVAAAELRSCRWSPPTVRWPEPPALAARCAWPCLPDVGWTPTAQQVGQTFRRRSPFAGRGCPRRAAAGAGSPRAAPSSTRTRRSARRAPRTALR